MKKFRFLFILIFLIIITILGIYFNQRRTIIYAPVKEENYSYKVLKQKITDLNQDIVNTYLVQSKHFILQIGRDYSIYLIVKLAEDSYFKVSRDLGCRLGPPRSKLILLSSPRFLMEAPGAERTGGFQRKPGEILMRGYDPRTESPEITRIIAVHEITHLFIDRLWGGTHRKHPRLQRMLDEGFAYEEQGMKESEIFASLDTIRLLVPLTDLQENQCFESRDKGFYKCVWEYVLMIRFIREKYGMRTYRSFLYSLKDNGLPFSIEKALKMTFQEFDKQFLAYANEKYSKWKEETRKT